MRRRKFMAVMARTAACWPLGVSAQQTAKRPVIGQLWHAGSAEEEGKYLIALERGFSDLGYAAGQNIFFEYRFPAEKYERFNELAADLARMKVDVIVAVCVSACNFGP
jgi:putative ABC transport system substrate-binding protein